MLEGSVWTGDDVGSGPVWTGDDTISGPVWTGDNTSPNPVWTGDGDDTSPVNLNTFSAATKRVLLSILIFVVIMTVVIVPIILIVNHQSSGIAESTSTASADDDTGDAVAADYYTRSEVDNHLTNYHTKTELNNILPKGVWAEASYWYYGNNNANYEANRSHLTEQFNLSGPGNPNFIQEHFVGNWGFPGDPDGTGAPAWWSSAPVCHEIVQRWTFASPYLDDAGQESNHYKVFLTKRKETMYDILNYSIVALLFQKHILVHRCR